MRGLAASPPAGSHRRSLVADRSRPSTRASGRRRRAARLAAALALVGGSLALAPLSAQAAHETTQAALTAWQRHSGGPGAAVLGGDDSSRWALSSGVRDIYARSPIGPDDHHRIGSQTKTYTAAVVLQLVDEGRVRLDAPIEQYLPGLLTSPYDGTAITVRHLLQHRSGIPAYTDGAPRAQLDGTYLMPDLVAAGVAQSPWFAPGTSTRYSNTNYIVLGMLIESVTGQTVQAAITDRIITPLGLADTRFPDAGDRSIGAPAVHGYAYGSLPPITIWIDISNLFEPSLGGTSGGIISTLNDQVTFYRALFDGDVISAASLAEMRTPSAGIKDGYGLGVYKLELSCGTAWGHNGATPGYFAETLVGDNGRHAAILTNHVSSDSSEPSGKTVLDKAICDG